MLKYFQKQNGQVMIITVVALSGAFLVAASIAGLLMVYQIRAGNDAVNSAKAIFAADAGIEAVIFCYFKGCDPYTYETINITFDGEVNEVYAISNSNLTPDILSIRVQGFAASGKVVRILEAEFLK